MTIIAQGAEALIRQEEGSVVKERIIKGYRIRQIDESLRRKRTRLEARLIREARRVGVATPQIAEEGESSIRMEFIRGARIKEFVSSKNCKKIAEKIGKSVALLHTYNIIHGDLTTSNMILKIKGNGEEDSGSKKGKSLPDSDLYFIDFGLGFISSRAEDKATDLHVLKEAITATHFSIAGKFWDAVLSTYKKNYPESEKVIKTLLKIEKRGRYTKRN
jgi:Kae1-associated kinase Bud32